MGRKKEKTVEEKNCGVCFVIFICELLMVLSSVSFVYLTVAIYLPTERIFKSGFETEPVMCHTTKVDSATHCEWASCGEWCLTKASGFCPKIYATVRRNGTNIALRNCSKINTVNCPPANEDSVKRYNCNSNTTECSKLTGIFSCRLGWCANFSEIYNCYNLQYSPDPAISSQDDNLKLNGMFDCVDNWCKLLLKHPKCDRLCNKITTTNVNVYLRVDNNVVAADCLTVEDLVDLSIDTLDTRPPETVTHPSIDSGQATNGNNTVALVNQKASNLIWFEPPDNPTVLLAICTNVYRKENQGQFVAYDCINGTTLPITRIPSPFMKFPELWEILRNSNQLVDPTMKYLPPQHSLTIHNETKLFINLEGCVNTLRGECKAFAAVYGCDGSLDLAESHYKCFYRKDDSSMSLARFDLNEAWLQFLISICIPTVIFIASFVTLMAAVKMIRIRDDGRMKCRLNCWSPNDDDDDDERFSIQLNELNDQKPT